MKLHEKCEQTNKLQIYDSENRKLDTKKHSLTSTIIQ